MMFELYTALQWLFSYIAHTAVLQGSVLYDLRAMIHTYINNIL